MLAISFLFSCVTGWCLAPAVLYVLSLAALETSNQQPTAQQLRPSKRFYVNIILWAITKWRATIARCEAQPLPLFSMDFNMTSNSNKENSPPTIYLLMLFFFLVSHDCCAIVIYLIANISVLPSSLHSALHSPYCRETEAVILILAMQM
jgi:hypothetical protein